MERDGKTIKTLETALDIVEYIADNGGARTAEIADAIGKSKSTVHYHLSTLQQRRFLVEEDGEYRVGYHSLNIAGKTLAEKEFYHVAKREVESLAAETGETTQIIAEEHGKGVYLHQSRGPRAVQTDSHIGTERYLHCTAFGKVILAHKSKERVEEILDRYGLPKRTENTITSRTELYDELETVRQNGIGFDDEEQIEGIRCVAAPVFARDGEVACVLSLSSPTKRMDETRFREEIPDLVSQSAKIIEIDSRHS